MLFFEAPFPSRLLCGDCMYEMCDPSTFLVASYGHLIAPFEPGGQPSPNVMPVDCVRPAHRKLLQTVPQSKRITTGRKSMFKQPGNTPRKGAAKVADYRYSKVSGCTVPSPVFWHASDRLLLCALHRTVCATPFDSVHVLGLYPRLLCELRARVCRSQRAAAAVTRRVAA